MGERNADNMEMHPLCGADGLDDSVDVEAGSCQPAGAGRRATWISQSRQKQSQHPSIPPGADGARHRPRGVSRMSSNLTTSASNSGATLTPGESAGAGGSSRTGGGAGASLRAGGVTADSSSGPPNRFRTHDKEDMDVNFGGVDSQYSHTFLTGSHDIGVMQSKLFKLMRDFNAGNLRAFGRNVSIDQMECIREQQEELARQHFELGSQRHLFPPLSEEALQQSSAGFQRLMSQLQLLSSSIEKLHTSDHTEHETS